MPGDTYPKFRAAAVQAAPVFLDRDATLEKLDDWTGKAARDGADLVVFGESFVPAFPVWNLIYAPIDQHEFFRRLFDNAIEIPGPAFDKISRIAKAHGVVLSVGVTEKSPISMGTMWNTNLIFDRSGTLLNRHRKLVPTWAEKLTWANGDAAHLRVERTDVGRLGVLICGENTNTLARFALLADGEQVHISTYPPVWPVRRPDQGRNYNLTEAIRIRAAAHAFEGKVYNIVASCALDGDAIDQLSRGDPQIRRLLEDAPPPASMIVGPDGDLVTDPLVGGEGIVAADVDVGLSIAQKSIHDIVGGYNRFDIFRVEVDRTPNEPLHVRRSTPADEDSAARPDVHLRMLADGSGPPPGRDTPRRVEDR